MPPIPAMDLHSRFPSVADLKSRARRRIPPFVWAYLDSATGREAALHRNRARLDDIGFMPSVLDGEVPCDLSTRFLGQDYDLPFGIAPVGMSGLMWPDAEFLLAQAARRAKIPYSMSTVATKTPEQMARYLDGRGWFQLYPPRDVDVRLDMLARARDSGFSTIVLTVDVPVASRREKQVRGGLTNPPSLNARLVTQVLTRPVWLAGMLARWPLPHMATLDKYTGGSMPMSSIAHIGYLLRTAPDWDYVRWLREHWEGDLIVKGIMRPEDATRLEAEGVDAVWVSNHAGRQFDAAPAAIDVLAEIRAATTLPLIFDSGIEGGMDMLRAIALGADFVMLGRAWHYALGALGRDGPDHLTDILRQDLISCLGHLGATKPTDVRGKAIQHIPMVVP